MLFTSLAKPNETDYVLSNKTLKFLFLFFYPWVKIIVCPTNFCVFCSFCYPHSPSAECFSLLRDTRREMQFPAPALQALLLLWA